MNWPLTFGMTLTSRSQNEFPCSTHELFHVWWKSVQRLWHRSQNLVWPSQWGDLDLKVMHTQGQRMSCSALHLYHIKFGENRSNGMGTAAKKPIWPLTLGWPWLQGHVWNGNCIDMFHTKFGENRKKGICTVAEIVKVTLDLAVTLTFDLPKI